MENGVDDQLDDYNAASILFSLRDAKLNQQTAAKLEAMKSRFREKTAANSPSSSLDDKVNQIRTRKRKVNQNKSPLAVAFQDTIGECGSSTTRQCQNAVKLVGYTPPDVPPFRAIVDIIDVNKCSKPCQKALTSTDVKRHQLRLSLSKDHVIKYLLPMLNEGEDVNRGIDVTTYDEGGNAYNMKFKEWSDGKMYVLTTKGWEEFFDHHQLKKLDVVVVWMFRRKDTLQLCFAISCHKLQPEERERLTSSSE